MEQKLSKDGDIYPIYEHSSEQQERKHDSHNN